MVDHPRASAGNVLHPETALFSRVKTLPDTLNARVLHEKYVVEKLSLQQISRQFASSKAGVLAALQRAGIKRRERHQPHGRPANPPYGKRIVKGKLVDCPSEQRAIQLALKLKREGKNLLAIAAQLSVAGYKTRVGHTRWHHETIRLILKRHGSAN